MPVRQHLGLRQKAGLALSPAMRQSLHVLSLGPADLADEIARETSENPFLESMAPRSGISAYEVALDTVAAQPTLGEDLRRQIAAMHLNDDLRALALYLTGALRPDGYLDATLAELAAETGQPESAVAAALQALQGCEPAGVGARDLAECLMLQLVDRGLDQGLARAVVARLDLFAEDRWPRLAGELSLDPGRVRDIDAMLRSLSPQPVADTAPGPATLVPDLAIETDESGNLVVELTGAARPALTLNRALLAQVPDPDDPFVAAARDRAETLLAAVAARGRTLQRIGLRLAQDQHRFFTDGPEHLVPRSRRQMAEALGLHPSTLGRAVAGKAVAAGGVVYPLSMFFSTALPGGEGRAVSSFAVKLTIRRMIEAEPETAPLSDAAICARLHEDGVDITRRCVAKYRGCMKIPPSFERRRRRVKAAAE